MGTMLCRSLLTLSFLFTYLALELTRSFWVTAERVIFAMSYCLREKKKKSREIETVRGDKDDNICSASKYHGFSVGRRGKQMIVCAEEVYIQPHYFLKYIINRWLKPCIISKILVGIQWNYTVKYNFWWRKSIDICKFHKEEINYQLSMK